jgi:hypothetical protein
LYFPPFLFLHQQHSKIFLIFCSFDRNKIIANQTNLSTANESIKLNKMTSTGDMKPSDVHSEKTGRPIYGAAAEAAKGHLMGAAAANVEGNLQGAAKQRHEEKLAREVCSKINTRKIQNFG